jgi:hypothetical protein
MYSQSLTIMHPVPTIVCDCCHLTKFAYVGKVRVWKWNFPRRFEVMACGTLFCRRLRVGMTKEFGGAITEEPNRVRVRLFCKTGVMKRNSFLYECGQSCL